MRDADYAGQDIAGRGQPRKAYEIAPRSNVEGIREGEVLCDGCVEVSEGWERQERQRWEDGDTQGKLRLSVSRHRLAG